MHTPLKKIMIGFSTNVFDNPGDIVGSIDALSKHFKAIEFEIAEEAQQRLFSASQSQYKKIVEGVRKLIVKHDLDLTVHAAWFGKHTDLASANEDERRASIDLLKKSIDFCSDIGQTLVTYHPGYVKKASRPLLLENLRRSLLELVPYAKEKDVLLCAENMGADRPAFIVLTPEEQVELCLDTGTYLTLDIIHLASLISPGEQLDKSIDLLTPYVKNLHIADMLNQDHRHLPIGRGNLKLTAILKRLECNGFQGNAIVEEFVRDFTPDYYLQEAVAYRIQMNGLI